MALQALHEHYWPGDGGAPPAPGTLGYSSAVVIGCFYPGGIIRPKLTKRWQQRLNALLRWVPERWWVLFRMWQVLYSDDYRRAQDAVRIVATLPGMRDKHEWSEIGKRLWGTPGLREDMLRHLRAFELYGTVPHRNRHQANTALELAYFALKERGF